MLISSLRQGHEMPSPRCSAVASLSEPNSHLQGWEIQCPSFDSLVRLLGLCSFGTSLHIKYFVSSARRMLHEFSSRSLWTQRTKGTYNWSSDNIACFPFSHFTWELRLFSTFLRGTIRPTVQFHGVPTMLWFY